MKLTATLNVTVQHDDHENAIYATTESFIISITESSPPEVHDALNALVKAVLSERLTSICKSGD